MECFTVFTPLTVILLCFASVVAFSLWTPLRWFWLGPTWNNYSGSAFCFHSHVKSHVSSLMSWFTCWQVRPALSSCCSPGLLDVRGKVWSLVWSSVVLLCHCVVLVRDTLCCVFFLLCLLPVFLLYISPRALWWWVHDAGLKPGLKLTSAENKLNSLLSVLSSPRTPSASFPSRFEIYPLCFASRRA